MSGITEFNSAIGWIKNYTKIFRGYLAKLRVTNSYAQKKKDSVQAVLIQLHSVEQARNYPDNIESVSRLPNNIRLPDYIGLVKYCQSSIGGWDLNLVNDVHSVDCLALRCLRLISAFTAVTINCALLSPSSRFLSKSATTSCGKRAFSCCDLLLIELVAISESPYSWCDSVYAKINVIKGLKCDSLRGNFISVGAIHQIATPRSARNTIEAFNHNVIRGNTMAMYKSTQTHPKFLWRFFSCQQSKYFSVEANNEQEARSMLPDSPCLFSARIRQGVNRA